MGPVAPPRHTAPGECMYGMQTYDRMSQHVLHVAPRPVLGLEVHGGLKILEVLGLRHP